MGSRRNARVWRDSARLNEKRPHSARNDVDWKLSVDAPSRNCLGSLRRGQLVGTTRVAVQMAHIHEVSRRTFRSRPGIVNPGRGVPAAVAKLRSSPQSSRRRASKSTSLSPTRVSTDPMEQRRR